LSPVVNEKRQSTKSLDGGKEMAYVQTLTGVSNLGANERIERAPSAGLRIALIAHKFPPFIGGIEMHTFEVGRRIAAAGHAVTVLTGDPTGKLAREETVAGMRVRRIPAYPKSSDVFLAPGFYREIHDSDADIFHVQGFHTFVPPIAMFGAIRSSSAFVVTFHSGGHSSPLRNLIRGAQQAALRPLLLRADQLIAVSKFEAEHFAKGLRVPPEQITVVPNGAEIETPPAVLPSSKDRPLIVSVGRLERYKGHHRVIEAFAELLRKRPNAQLRILGEGPYKPQLSALVAQLNITDRVFIGGIPPEHRKQMGGILAAASAVVLLSEYEAHPVAALEAISLGRPVLANNSTGFREMAEEGMLRGVDPGASPTAIANAILEEVDNPNPRKPGAKVPNWDDCTKNLLDVYRAVLTRREKTTDSLTPRRAANAPSFRLDNH
jgi:glycosyltransferase involved in cell wall biosynthesis